MTERLAAAIKKRKEMNMTLNQCQNLVEPKLPIKLLDKGFTVFMKYTFLHTCQYGEDRKKDALVTTRFTDALSAQFWLVEV
jgi:hypothetical protein